MTEQKLKSACEFFARIECANNCDGQCLPRDCPCFVYAERGWVCTWFLNAVVPLNQALQAFVNQKMTESPKTGRRCTVCGKAFIPGSNRQRYCPECAQEAARVKHAKRSREYRARNDA